MGGLSQTFWSRIRGNSAFTKDKENVGNDKLTGSVRQETDTVSRTMNISVQNRRHSQLLLRNLRRSRIGKIYRERGPGGRSPSGRMSRLPCKEHLKGTSANPSCEKWHSPESLLYKTKERCKFREKCSFAHRLVE